MFLFCVCMFLCSLCLLIWWWWWWLLLYRAILRSRADSLRSHVILHEWLAYFIARFLISTEVVYLQCWHGWCHMNLLPSRRVLCTPYNHAPCHFMQSHIRKVCACLAVTCHLHFWQDDRDLLRATAVTRGWNGYRNKSQHRKLTLEKKILPPFRQGFEPATFQSRVRRSNHWAIPTPTYVWTWPTCFTGHWKSVICLSYTVDWALKINNPSLLCSWLGSINLWSISLQVSVHAATCLIGR